MNKTSEIAKDSAKGSFHMLWGLVVSTVILSITTIFIARLLGTDQYGLYTIVLTVPNLIGIFRDWSINMAVVKFTAQFRAEKRIDEIRSVYITGLIFEMAISLSLSLVSFFLAGYMAEYIFQRPAIAPLIQIASFSIFASGLIAAATAAFTGMERMELNSLTIVCQSIFKTIITITLVFVGLGTGGATIGFTAGTFIAGFLGLALTLNIYRQLPKPTSYKLEIRAYFSAMITYCLPLSFAAIIKGVLPQFYSFLLPIYYSTNNSIIGNYGVATNFVVLITFFATPITTMMFPAFSKLDSAKDREPLKNVFKFSVKYATLIVLPVTALVMSLAQPAVETLFGTAYNTAPLFLALLAIQYSYASIGYLSLSALLNGQGKSRFVLKMAILTGLIGFPMGYVSIMNFGVLGLIASTLIANLPSIFMGLRFIGKKYDARVDWVSSLKIVFSSTIAASITYLITLLPLPSWLLLIIGVIIFIVTFIPVLLLSKAIDAYDIENLLQMSRGIGIVGGLIQKILSILNKLMTALKTKK